MTAPSPPVNQLNPPITGPNKPSILSNTFARIPEVNCSTAQRGPFTTLPTKLLNILLRNPSRPPIAFSKLQKIILTIFFKPNLAAASVINEKGLIFFNVPRNLPNIKFNLPIKFFLTSLRIPLICPLTSFTKFLIFFSISTISPTTGSIKLSIPSSNPLVNSIKSVSCCDILLIASSPQVLGIEIGFVYNLSAALCASLTAAFFGTTEVGFSKVYVLSFCVGFTFSGVQVLNALV